MDKIFQLSLLIFAVISVAVGDVVLKRAAVEGSWLLALKSPWLLVAGGLYLAQILIFTHFFMAGWHLSLVGSLQTAFYALVVVGAGIFIYRESLTAVQWTGVVLALAGAVLINFES